MAEHEPDGEAPPSRYVLPPLWWEPCDDGRQVASGSRWRPGPGEPVPAAWEAVVQPREGGEWEAILTLNGQTFVWPDHATPGRSAIVCRAWVRRRLLAEVERRRWTAYVGHVRPGPRPRQSWATPTKGRPRSWATGRRGPGGAGSS